MLAVGAPPADDTWGDATAERQPYGKASECGYRMRSKCAVGVIGVMEVRVTDFTAPNPLRVR